MNNTQKVLELNNMLGVKLDINKLKQNHTKDMVFKICFTVLERYKINFATSITRIDMNLMKLYINDILDFVLENIYKKVTIKKEDLLNLHYHIAKPLTTTEKNIKPHLFGAWRDTSKYFPALTHENKAVRLLLTPPNNIDKEMKNLIIDFNAKIISQENTQKIESIIDFILISLIKIHPFDNANGKVFWILFDLLLWQHDFFPLFLQSKNHKPKLMQILSKYNHHQNLEKLKKDFYILMIDIYSHYKV